MTSMQQGSSKLRLSKVWNALLRAEAAGREGAVRKGWHVGRSGHYQAPVFERVWEDGSKEAIPWGVITDEDERTPDWVLLGGGTGEDPDPETYGDALDRLDLGEELRNTEWIPTMSVVRKDGGQGVKVLLIGGKPVKEDWVPSPNDIAFGKWVPVKATGSAQ